MGRPLLITRPFPQLRTDECNMVLREWRERYTPYSAIKNRNEVAGNVR